MVRFQVVPPCGGHPVLKFLKFLLSQFQVVPPCGGHLEQKEQKPAPTKFQVVPPCGGHLLFTPFLAINLSFKSCPRVGGI